MPSSSAIARKHPFITRIASTFAIALCSVAASAHAETQTHPAQGHASAAAPSEAAAANGVLNLNTATELELLRLPGVGPSRAKAILELRARMKHFEKLEDVMRVKGIGRATFRKLRPMLTLEGATTLVAKSGTRVRHAAPAPAPAH